MKRGFYTIMTAQFFSSLADNALFVAAIELLRSRQGSRVAERRTGAAVCILLCGAGALRGRFCRRQAQGPGHVHQQRHQGGGLPADALRHPPAAGLHRGGPGCCGLLARQVRHPHRTAAGRRSWSRPTAGSRASPSPPSSWACCWAASWWGRCCPACCCRSTCPWSTPASTRPAEAAIAVLVFVYAAAAMVQHCAFPLTGVTPRADADQPDGPAARLLALQHPPVARPARPDLAGHHHPVLGRERQPALHRAGLGFRGPGLWHHAGLGSGGRGGHRHCRGRGDRLHEACDWTRPPA